MPYSLEFEGIILSGFSKTVIDCSQKLADPNNCCPITPKLSNKPWAYKFDTGAGADNCDPIIKRRTEKGWTLDFIFNRENLSWAFGGVFYYLGVRGDNDPNNYADNNLSFQFTSDRKIKWVAHHYSGYCATDLGYQEVFYTASGLTPTICATDETKDFNVTITFDRYKHYTDCDIENDGGWNDLLPGPHLIPYTSTDTGVTSTHISTGYYLTNSTGSTLSGETEVYVYTEELNKKWANERQRRLGTLKIYLNGRPIYKLEDWEEVIPSSRGVQPFIQSWGGGTGLMNNIHYGVCCFNMKSIKYYEEPLDFVHVRHNFLTRLSDYDFNICGGPCEDEISGFVPNPSPTSTSTPTLTPTHTPSSTPTPTPTLTTSSTSTPTPTPTLTSSSTPTPTPTATQDLVIFNLDIEVSSGSIIVDFIANASQELNQDTDISVMVSLNLINEEILDVESVVTILSGQTSGTTRVELTGRTFDELDLTGNLSVGQIILDGYTYEVFAELNFITPIPNNDFTYVIIPDNNLVYTITPNNDLTYTLIPSNDLTYVTTPNNDLTYRLIPSNDLTSVSLPNNDLEYLVLPLNDVNYTLIANSDLTYTLIPNNDIEYNVLKPGNSFYGQIILGEDSVEGTCNCSVGECPRFYVTGDGPTFCESNIFVTNGDGFSLNGWGTIVYNGFYKTVNLDGSNVATYRTDCGTCPTTPTPTPTPTSTETPTPTPTPTVTYYYYYLLNCNLGDNKYGRSTNPSLSGTYNVDTNTCYAIVGIDNGPSYDYDLDILTIVTDCNDILCGVATSTPTPTSTETPTPTLTNTPTQTVTSTPTPTLTSSSTPTQTPTLTASSTSTPTQTLTNTPTQTVTASSTSTPTPTLTSSSTPTPTPTSTMILSAPTSTDPTLQIWFDASDITTFQPNGGNGQAITQWNDKAAIAHNAAPIGSSSTRPTITYNVQNGKTVLYFDQIDDGLESNMSTNLQSLSGATFIMVSKIINTSLVPQQLMLGGTRSGGSFSSNNNFEFSITGTANYPYRIGMGSGTVLSDMPKDSNFHIHTVTYNGTASYGNKVKHRVDSVERGLLVQQEPGSTTSATLNSIIFGVNSALGNDLYGYIGEVLIYTRTLTQFEITSTENYLKQKWGIA